MLRFEMRLEAKIGGGPIELEPVLVLVTGTEIVTVDISSSLIARVDVIRDDK